MRSLKVGFLTLFLFFNFLSPGDFGFHDLWAGEVMAEIGSSNGSSPSAASKTVTPEELESGIRQNMMRVEQFQFIRELGKKYGVRIYLFGGSSAGLAHYVKQDILRKKGDQSYSEKRFDYDFTNIFRSTQDADLVVDGPKAKLEALKNEIMARYPHLQGAKSEWELRLLRQDNEDKVALLNNPDFLNQHTDSHSVGLIEITEAQENESVWRDLRNWNEKNPPFIQDVLEGKLNFYFSEKHDTTSRAKKGQNPPILSVIRYFTKAFQYDLKIRDEDREVLKGIIEGFQTKDLESYVSGWLSRNAGKLYQHAVNLELAASVLDEFGLRQKLIHWSTQCESGGAIAHLLSREPLKSKPIGEGAGRTAKELRIHEVAHETNSFLAWESITRSNQGTVNALISRNGRQGENAAHGDGFYTRKGRIGARNTGLTIRFLVNPEAREGTDFTIHGDYILFKNRNALTVNIEDFNLDVMDYLNMLKEQKLSEHDRGVLFKLEHRIRTKLRSLDEDEVYLIQNQVVEELNSTGDIHPAWLAGAIGVLFKALKFEDWKLLFERSLNKIPIASLSVFNTFLFSSNASSFLEARKMFISYSDQDRLISFLNSYVDAEIVDGDLEVIRAAIRKHKQQLAAILSLDKKKTPWSKLYYFIQDQWRSMDDNSLGEKSFKFDSALLSLLSNPGIFRFREIYDYLKKSKAKTILHELHSEVSVDEYILAKSFSHPSSMEHKPILVEILKNFTSSGKELQLFTLMIRYSHLIMDSDIPALMIARLEGEERKKLFNELKKDKNFLQNFQGWISLGKIMSADEVGMLFETILDSNKGAYQLPFLEWALSQKEGGLKQGATRVLFGDLSLRNSLVDPLRDKAVPMEGDLAKDRGKQGPAFDAVACRDSLIKIFGG